MEKSAQQHQSNFGKLKNYLYRHSLTQHQLDVPPRRTRQILWLWESA